VASAPVTEPADTAPASRRTSSTKYAPEIPSVETSPAPSAMSEPMALPSNQDRSSSGSMPTSPAAGATNSDTATKLKTALPSVAINEAGPEASDGDAHIQKDTSQISQQIASMTSNKSTLVPMAGP